jgi:class 3 adenylate cyclase
MDSGSGKEPGREPAGSIDLERLLEERERLEAIIKQKFTRIVTVMFTDMKGSTAMAENEGDMAARYLIKKNIDIVVPLVRENRGVLVKTMGDGTLSYFDSAQDAVRTAVRIQQSVDAFNGSREARTALQVRVGLNTGTGIVEKNDIFGDVVNVASRYETLASPGEVYISESCYNALENREEFYCRHVKTSRLKEKKGLHKVFKVFWDEEEIARDKLERPAGVEDSEELEETISLDALRKRQAAAIPEDTEQAREVLRRTKQLEREGELIELYLLCQQHQYPSVQELHHRLVEEVESAESTQTNLNGRPVLWFFRDSITIGRVPDADFPLTNKAMSRVPLKLGIRGGAGYLTLESRGAKDLKSVELERDGARKPVAPDVEQALGTAGQIIFSICFPIEYRVFKERFLVLRLLDPQECLRKNFTFTLQEIWRDFPQESARQIVIGT